MFRLTPTNIRRTLKLNRPIYRRTAAYGHFGRAPDKDGGFSWEKTDLAAQPEEGVLSRSSPAVIPDVRSDGRAVAPGHLRFGRGRARA